MNSLFRPAIFQQFPEVVAAMSLRDASRPGGFSMLSTNITEPEAAANRAHFAKALGFEQSKLAVANLQHGDIIHEITSYHDATKWPKVDALVTNNSGWLLGVTIADCVGILLYDPQAHTMAAIHSGWRGSLANIAGKTVHQMQDRYGLAAGDLYAFGSPAPHKDEYETSLEIATQFDSKYSKPSREGHAWFDNQAVVLDQLLTAGLKRERMEVDRRSSISDPQLHSFRRDAKQAGRSLVAIGLKG